ncbi:MAG: hypothetical protein KGJ24_02600 [Burkholderiales bacterium]|nr:hypothetical protein [Burkholderiales bacterium]MDE2565556.1 hypothetical protein [Burkholderiales bacterium]
MRSAFRAGALAALALSSTLIGRPALAGPADYVLTPIVEQGEREIDFKAGSARARDGTHDGAQSLGLGWGARSWWFTELYAKWHQTPGTSGGFDAWEWENRFQLTETGKYPVDVGLLLEIERPRLRSEGYELRWGPLLQADVAPDLQANLNLLWQRHVRTTEPAQTLFGYQWQLKYRWHESLEVGLQGLGDTGPWSDWAPSQAQAHVAGPAVFGRVAVGAHQALRYNAALLFGASPGAPRQTLRLQTEYEF